MTGLESGRRVLPWLVLATLSGSVHAFFSAAWAAGSDLLLSTVGQIASEISALGPSKRALLLGVIAAVKAGVTSIPLVDAALRSSDGAGRSSEGVSSLPVSASPSTGLSRWWRAPLG